MSLSILQAKMGQKITHYTASDFHSQDNAVGAWHPAGRSEVSPFKAQILFVCTADNFSTMYIPFLAAVLDVKTETIACALQRLVESRMLQRRSMPHCDIFSLTPDGYSALAAISRRKPEIFTMTRKLLAENAAHLGKNEVPNPVFYNPPH